MATKFYDQYGAELTRGNQSQRSQLTNNAFGLNPNTGINSGNFDLGVAPTYLELEAMYNGGSDLSVKIVNTAVDEALKYWRKFEHPNPAVVARIEAAEEIYDLKHIVRNALYDSRLYGGSILFPIFSDEVSVNELKEPLDVSTIEQDSIESFRHLDRWSVYKIINQLYDPLRPDFFAPKYLVIAYGGQPIHLSRVVKTEGTYLPIRLYMNNNWWNKSILTDVYQLLLQIATIERVMGEISKKATYDVLKLSGLKTSVSDPQGQQNLQNRMDSLNYFQSFYRATVIDGEDDFEHHESSMEGYAKILEVFYKRISGSTGIPLSRLIGEQQSGLNTEGGANQDESNFTSMVEIYQDTTVRPMLDEVDTFFLRNEFGEEYDEIITELSWDFHKPKFENAELESKVKSESLERIQAGLTLGIIDLESAKKECIKEEIFSEEFLMPNNMKEEKEDSRVSKLPEIAIKGAWE